MFGVETRKIGVYNFDYFAVDIKVGGKFRMGSREFTLGDFGCALCNLSKDYVTKLLYLGGVLNQTRRAIHFAGGYHRQLFETAHKQIHTICDFIKDTKPFCWFDVEDSLRLVDHAFASSALDEVDRMYSGSIEPGTEETYALIGRIKETQRLATYLIGVYCYLCNDTANFSTMMVNYVQHLMCCRSRQKNELALLAAAFCNNKEMQEQLEAANLNKELDGVNLRTRVTSVSAVMFDEQDSAYIVRRLYFGRLMDFFVTEWFEGMENGHYLWRCGVCKQYFLMTTAHRQLYCKNFNPKYGTTCDHVANNRRISKEKGLERQKKKDNPLWIIRNKRYASIRKNKSLGKYSDAVSDEAKQLLDGYFQMAESDTRYADEHYIEDIQLENLYTRTACSARTFICCRQSISCASNACFIIIIKDYLRVTFKGETEIQA